MEMLDKEISHVLGGTKQDVSRFHHATKDGMQFKRMSGLFLDFSI